MKLIVAGGRNITDYNLIKASIDKLNDITEIVSGNASGVDRFGERYAKERGIDLVIFPANWTKYGQAGGPIRNERMAIYADALLAIWDGKSKGTASMIKLALKHKLTVWTVKLNES